MNDGFDKDLAAARATIERAEREMESILDAMEKLRETLVDLSIFIGHLEDYKSDA